MAIYPAYTLRNEDLEIIGAYGLASDNKCWLNLRDNDGRRGEDKWFDSEEAMRNYVGETIGVVLVGFYTGG